MSKHTLLWARIRKAGSTIRRLRAELGEARASQIRQANWLRRLRAERDAATAKRDAARAALADMEELLRSVLVRRPANAQAWNVVHGEYNVLREEGQMPEWAHRARYPREKGEEAGHGH